MAKKGRDRWFEQIQLILHLLHMMMEVENYEWDGIDAERLHCGGNPPPDPTPEEASRFSEENWGGDEECVNCEECEVQNSGIMFVLLTIPQQYSEGSLLMFQKISKCPDVLQKKTYFAVRVFNPFAPPIETMHLQQCLESTNSSKSRPTSSGWR